MDTILDSPSSNSMSFLSLVTTLFIREVYPLSSNLATLATVESIERWMDGNHPITNLTLLGEDLNFIPRAQIICPNPMTFPRQERMLSRHA